MDWWRQLSIAAWRFLDTHGHVGAFLFLLVEEAGTPIPIPGDVVMLLAGVRAGQGKIDLFEILAVMQVATMLGASILYWLARRAGRRVVYRLGRHVGLTEARLERAALELQRRGALAVVIGRLTPGLRIATPLICGVLAYPFRQFFPAMALGSFIYILAYTLVGYYFGGRVMDWVHSLELPLGLVVASVVLVGLLFWIVRIGRRETVPARCPELRERLWAGAASGLIATVTSGLLLNVLINLVGLLASGEVDTGYRELIILLRELARRAPGAAAALFLLPAFLGVGTALGALYGAWLGNRAYGRGRLVGAAFSLLPLGVLLLVVLPLVGAGVAGVALDAGPIPALGEAIRHVAFGLILGTVYPALARPRETRRSATRRAISSDGTSEVLPSTAEPTAAGVYPGVSTEMPSSPVRPGPRATS